MKYKEEQLRALKDNELYQLSVQLMIYNQDFFIETRSKKKLLKDLNAKERLIKEILKAQLNMNANNNPWISGSFYLSTSAIVITGLAVLSKTVHWTLLPIIIIASILIISLIGILQLRNDDKITDKSFQSLLKETYKFLPLIGKWKRQK